MMDSVREMIAPYVEKDPSKFCTYEEFEAGIATLKEFCILRAESIRGQLDGSIPSTSDGQSADGASLVDAGDMEISAMGSMGITEKMEGTAPEAAGESLQRPDGEAGESFEQGKMPDMNGGTNDFAANNTQSWILVSISAAILLLGLIVAFVFKRR